MQLVVRTGEPYAELAEVLQRVRADAVVVGCSMQAQYRLAGSRRPSWCAAAAGRSLSPPEVLERASVKASCRTH